VATRLSRDRVGRPWGRRHAAVVYGPFATSTPSGSPQPLQRSVGAHVVTTNTEPGLGFAFGWRLTARLAVTPLEDVPPNPS
jgi:hypothetical protein